MADYYSILDKTISGLPNNSPEIRNAVFKKARTAIETQLRNMAPSPSEDAIDSQLQLLEEAILLIESEYAPQFDEMPVDELPEPEVAELETDPLLEQGVPEASPVPELSASAPATESVVERVETAIDKIQSEVPSSVGLDASNTDSNLGSVDVNPATSGILDPIMSSDGSSPSTVGMDLDEKKSSGFLGGLIKLLVILGLLGGAGYAVWKNKDVLTDIANNLMKPADVVEESSTTTENSKPINETEEETPAIETVEETSEDTNPEPATPELIEPEVVKPEVIEPEITKPEVTEPEVTEPVTDTTQETVQEETTPSTQQSGVIPIGEVAYLYEEGSAGSGATRTNAAITWEIKQESLKEGIAPEPVIIGKMDVPEKAMSIDITIKRNIDEAVSASHMIELRFNTPADFTGKSVESIARFVMKATEEAPGEPLVAVPVKVSEGLFLDRA